MPLHVMNLGTQFGEGKMAFETTRLLETPGSMILHFSRGCNQAQGFGT